MLNTQEFFLQLTHYPYWQLKLSSISVFKMTQEKLRRYDGNFLMLITKLWGSDRRKILFVTIKRFTAADMHQKAGWKKGKQFNFAGKPNPARTAGKSSPAGFRSGSSCSSTLGIWAPLGQSDQSEGISRNWRRTTGAI